MGTMFSTHLDGDASNEQLILESAYGRLDSMQHPANDAEICHEMQITKDEFHQMLDQIKLPSVGHFAKVASQDGDTNSEPLIRYIPDMCRRDSSVVLRQSDIKQLLTKAIETLPKEEQLVLSLYYCDQLSLEEIDKVLGLGRTGVSRLYTKAVLRLRSRIRE